MTQPIPADEIDAADISIRRRLERGDKRRLDEAKILETAERLRLRIEARFPDAGLSGVAETLCEIARETQATIQWISRPSYLLRISVWGLILLLITGLGFVAMHVHADARGALELGNFIQISEAAINNILLIGAAILFLISIESRQKRKRVIRALNQLRTVAHVIDMHQLTKDPYLTQSPIEETPHSVKRVLSAPLLQRYLDYCSELLSITSKIGFLYAQHFEDQLCLDAAHDLEDLCSGVSRKIWQKILILSKSCDD